MTSGLRIVCDENIAGAAEMFRDFGDLVLLGGRAIDRASLANADALLVRSITRVDQELLAGTPVRFVGSATSGFDHIDRDYLAGEGIAFACAPGSNANSVVEYVLAAIAGTQDYWERLEQGAEVGIVGYGYVGQCLASRLQALGFACRVTDPWLDRANLADGASLDEVLRCEVVSLHCSLTRRQPWPSYHLLDETRLAALGPGQLLINASRGAVIDQTALRQRLALGLGPVSVLDVWEHEPQVDTELLRQLQFGTAHIAGYSLDGKLDGTRQLLRALESTFEADKSLQARTQGQRPPPITVPGQISGAALARWLIASRYDIALDDGLLRQLAAGPSTQIGPGFDALRRDYRERRELAGSVISMAAAGTAEKRLIAALGCSLESADGR